MTSKYSGARYEAVTPNQHLLGGLAAILSCETNFESLQVDRIKGSCWSVFFSFTCNNNNLRMETTNWCHLKGKLLGEHRRIIIEFVPKRKKKDTMPCEKPVTEEEKGKKYKPHPRKSPSQTPGLSKHAPIFRFGNIYKEKPQQFLSVKSRREKSRVT